PQDRGRPRGHDRAGERSRPGHDRAHHAPPPRRPHLRRRLRGSTGLVKGRVLVVDDERRQRDILQMILEAEGYETTTASNGRQALQAAGGELFDVVLTDLKMPDMNGIELLSELPKTPSGPCLILLTAHGTIDSAVDAMRKGAFDYLTKPLEKDELLLTL